MEKYTGTIRGITFGLGQEDYMWGADAPSGLGIPTPEYVDTGHPRDGTIGGIDRVAKRTIRIPITIVGSAYVDGENFYTAAEAAEQALEVLKRAWRPSSDNVELDLRLAGPERRYFGRTRGLEVDVTRLEQGIVFADGTFDALEWYAYDVEAFELETPDTSSPITITNAGNAATTRCVLTIVGNGNKPVIVNYSDPYQGFIRFRQPVGVGQEVSINLTNYRIFNPDVESMYYDEKVSPMSTFFVLEPGDNTVAFSGCDSIKYRIRAAYF
jgi:hypothetical protein